MFTIKLYRAGQLKRIAQADSIDVGELASAQGDARELVLHRKDETDTYYVGPPDAVSPDHHPFTFDRAIVENALGRTTEDMRARPRRVLAEVRR